MKTTILVTMLATTSAAFGQERVDRYGGALSVQGKATGFFSLARLDDRWWLVTPEGHGFVSMGVVHLRQSQRSPLVQQRYGGDPKAFMADAAANLRAWGFNTAGYGCTYKDALEIPEPLPYLVSIEVLFTSMWRGGEFHYDDVFDSAWQRAAREEIAAFCRPVRDDRALIGYYLTDTPAWRLKRRGEGDWLTYYRSLPADAPGKRRYVEFLVERLGSVEAVAGRYGVKADTAEGLRAATGWSIDLADRQILADDEAFVAVIAQEYYRLCHEAIRANDRNHLIFGDRYFDADIPETILQAALPYVDAIAIQPPAKAQFARPLFDKVYAVAGKPILICDFAMNFPTPEYPKVMWASFPTEDAAADAYEAWLRDAFATPYILGVHRCTYVDQPKNVLKQGLVRLDGTPYETTVRRYAQVHRALYERLYGWNSK
ncbi:MAG: hypothetical protein GX601_18375 [Anaerolineales bacterium]|nr:hypothetical protein [Anaerolineales bacterium]